MGLQTPARGPDVALGKPQCCPQQDPSIQLLGKPCDLLQYLLICKFEMLISFPAPNTVSECESLCHCDVALLPKCLAGDLLARSLIKIKEIRFIHCC